jgi:hypothetical protein
MTNETNQIPATLGSAEKPQVANSEFAIFSDIVELPSQGVFYPHKKGNVPVEYLTASDIDNTGLD